MTVTIFLGLGSNIGHRIKYIQEACRALEQTVGSTVLQSSYYQTGAWGLEDQAYFVNQVIQMQTSLSPQELLKCCQQIEKSLGRIKNEVWGPRCIDIDLLIYGNEQFKSTELQIPHLQLAFRNFVLIPLCEIAKNWIHPVSNQSFEVLLDQCKDTLDVRKLVINESLNP